MWTGSHLGDHGQGRSLAVSPPRSTVEEPGPAHRPEGAWVGGSWMAHRPPCLNTQHWPLPKGL